MHLSNVIKAIAFLSSGLAPVVLAFTIPIPLSGSDFSPRKMFSSVLAAESPDERIAASFDPDVSAYYRLTNQHTGPGKALDVVVINNQYKLRVLNLDEYSSSQSWQFSERTGGKYDLSTLWLGPSKMLDVFNNAGVNSPFVHLADEGDFSGQFWTITSWGDGSWGLTNDFTGPNKHLGISSDTKEPVLIAGNHPSIRWYFTKIE